MRKKLGCFSLLILSTLVIIPVAADYTIDQQCVVHGEYPAVSKDPDAPTWQSFTTGESVNNINRVGLMLRGDPSVFYQLNCYVNDNPDLETPVAFSPLLYEGTGELDADVMFDFKPAPISPSTTYYIVLFENMASDQAISIAQDQANNYSEGRADTNENGDYCFLTYYDSTYEGPESSESSESANSLNVAK
ncbi:MAG: hypothetical protein ACFFGZ_10135 [Candidatus Thorarchaeota archaeon]